MDKLLAVISRFASSQYILQVHWYSACTCCDVLGLRVCMQDTQEVEVIATEDMKPDKAFTFVVLLECR